MVQTELQAAARRDQDAVAAVRAELHETTERLVAIDAARGQIQRRLGAIEADYADERNARLRAERASRCGHRPDRGRTTAAGPRPDGERSTG